MKFFSVILVLTCLLNIQCKKATAQSITSPVYETEGLFLKGFIQGTAWTMNEIDVNASSGPGAGLVFGYNFNSNWGLFLSLDGSNIETEIGNYGLGHFDLGVQYIFGNPSDRIKPFIKSSVNGFAAVDQESEITGSGFSLGPGLLIFFSERWAINASYRHNWINITEAKVDTLTLSLDEKATSGRLSIGLTYHF